MKRKRIEIVLMMGVASIIAIYLQWGRDMELCSIRPETSPNTYFEDVTIIANKLYIHDKFFRLQSMMG